MILIALLMSAADEGSNTQSGDKMQVSEYIAIYTIRCISPAEDKICK